MKIKAIMVLLVVTAFLFSCASFSYPVAHDKSFPADGRYEIFGPVISKGKIISILGLIWYGGTRYVDLGSEAEKRYGTKVDDVVNVSVDERITSVLGVVTIIEYTLRGIAIRYTDTPSAAGE